MRTLDAQKITPLGSYALVSIDPPDVGLDLLLPDGVKVGAYETGRIEGLGGGSPDEPLPAGLEVGQQVILIPGPFISLGEKRGLIPFRNLAAVLG